MFWVRWEQHALNELAHFWTEGDSGLRQAITAATQIIDKRLKQNPYPEGESRSRGRRITFCPTLAVIFRVEADGRTVSVLQIRLFKRRGQ